MARNELGFGSVSVCMNNTWEHKQLTDICSIKTGKWDANHAKQEGKYRFYTCASQFLFCDTASFSGKCIIVPGNGDIGLVFYYDGDFDAYQRTYVLHNISVNAKYLYYYFLLKWRVSNSDKQFGSTVKYIRMKNFTDMIVPVPSLPEQERIVAKIEELFAELDKSVAALKKAKEQVEVYKESVAQSLFEFAGTEEQFDTYTLGQVVDQKDGLRRGPFGSTIKKSFFVDHGYKVYEQGNAINDDPYRGRYYINQDKYDELVQFQINPQDLLVSCSGVTLGRIVELPDDAEPGVINQALLRIRLNNDLILNKYFIYYFRSAFFQRKIFEKSQGTGMPNLVGIKKFKQIEIKLPSVEVQHIIIKKMKEINYNCAKCGDYINDMLEKANIFRQTILKKAFEGEL